MFFGKSYLYPYYGLERVMASVKEPQGYSEHSKSEASTRLFCSEFEVFVRGAGLLGGDDE